MAKLFNLARMTTATTGTGTITLGTAASGYLTFALAGVADGDIVSYGIEDGSSSETGIGTYTSSGTTLSRTVVKSTNSDAAISLSGTAEVFITPLAADLFKVVLPQNRLTLTSGTAITTSDVTGATSIYLTAGQSITSDGKSITHDAAAQLTLPLNSNSGHAGYHQSGKNFDVFRINDGGTIRIGTGPAWTSDTARGSGASTTEIHAFGNTGVWTNANTMTVRFGTLSGDTVSVAADRAVYLGSFRATANGQTEDSAGKRFLYNLYNQARRTLVRNYATVSWTFSTTTPGSGAYKIANSVSTNMVEVLSGLAGGGVSVHARGIHIGDGTSREIGIGIGLGSSTTSSHTTGQVANTSSIRDNSFAEYEGFLALGYQDFRWLEQCFSAGITVTSYGVSADSRLKCGLSGVIWQ